MLWIHYLKGQQRRCQSIRKTVSPDLLNHFIQTGILRDHIHVGWLCTSWFMSQPKFNATAVSDLTFTATQAERKRVEVRMMDGWTPIRLPWSRPESCPITDQQLIFVFLLFVSFPKIKHTVTATGRFVKIRNFTDVGTGCKKKIWSYAEKADIDVLVWWGKNPSLKKITV